MFGEKILAGQYDFSIDQKNRMFLPAQTGRESGDNVYLCYDNDIECYTIYSEKAISNILDKYTLKIDLAKTADELKLSKLMYLEFAKSIIKVCSVDSAGRITLPSDIFHPSSTVHIIGGGDHLILMLDTTKKKK